MIRLEIFIRVNIDRKKNSLFRTGSYLPLTISLNNYLMYVTYNVVCHLECDVHLLTTFSDSTF